MKITHLSDHRVLISRLQAFSGGGSKMILSTVTAAFGSLQALSLDQTQRIAGVPGKTFVIYLDGAENIKENDQLKDEYGEIYTVMRGGVTRWQHGAMDYKEVYLMKT